MKLKFSKSEVFNIPNFLSFFRLVLIPFIVIFYLKLDNNFLAIAILLLSGLTDILDGWIARKFNMVSDLGKILDPIMDKLTQAAIILCLCIRYEKMLYLFLLMSIKEIITAITGILGISKSGQVKGALWHGKLATCTLYLMIIVHMIYDLSIMVSDILILVCACVMCMSFVLYVSRNIKLIKK